MVVELILGPKAAEQKPADLFIMGVIITTMSIMLALFASLILPTYIFPEHMSSWVLFFSVLAFVQLINKVLMIEENKDVTFTEEDPISRHKEILFIYFFLFFGMVISFSFWFTALPQPLVNTLFSDQLGEISRIQNVRVAITGSFITGAASASFGNNLTNATMFWIILFNNIRLTFLFLSFAFIYGAGAVLLLAWNASVVGVAIGNLIKGAIVTTGGFLSMSVSYFKVLPFSFFSFFLHGIFEVLAYFIGAIAGGIISAAIIRKHYEVPIIFNRVLKDVLFFVAFAILLIIIGAYIEVYITPRL